MQRGGAATKIRPQTSYLNPGLRPGLISYAPPALMHSRKIVLCNTKYSSIHFHLMKVKMILPALTEATSPLFRPIKYSLFPPLGLATLAAYLSADDEVSITDEHVEQLRLDDEPELVVIQVYITSAYRSYRIADHYRRRGAYVVLGGLHVTSLPDEAGEHADTIFVGPGEDTWPQFLRDYRAGNPARRYQSQMRTLASLPPIRRDLIKRHLYLVPNSIVV